MVHIKVIDSIMGSGKTSWAIQMMQQAPSTMRFIYVTPTLDEVNRIIKAVPSRKFKQPEKQHGRGTKLNSLKTLAKNGEDIATTHNLFSYADQELMDLLEQAGYTLIIDEVLDVLTPVKNITKDDIVLLRDSGSIAINEDGQVIWQKGETFNSKYNELKNYALAGNLYTNGKDTFYWDYHPGIFKLFREVYLLTYLFEAQKIRYYFDLHTISYQCFDIRKVNEQYILVDKTENEDRGRYNELIDIYNGNLNDIGDKHSLSKSWFDERATRDDMKALKDNLYNYLRNKINARADEILWSTYVEHRHKIKGKGFSLDSCFAPYNVRATNQYKNKTTLAYCINYHMDPNEMRYYRDNGIEVNERLLALSIMLQWIFRSAVREGNPIKIYIPSKRMRDLLVQWCTYEI